jgi:predicted phage terminase large subunit-like protein
MDFEFFYIKRRFLKEPAMLLMKVYAMILMGVAIAIGISLPPRSGKSYLVSMFCAWILGMIPEASIMRNTCTATLYRKLSYDTRAIVNSTKYRKVFPYIQLSDNKANIDGWNTNQAKQVSYFGAGVSGTIIGLGANIAINDDLYKSMADALSMTTNESVKMWKKSAHDSRKERNCPEIFIGTRWSKGDIIGEALETGKILPENYIAIPALLEKDGELVSFCEDVKTTIEYLKIKDEVDKSIFEAEYQQNPIESEGLLFPEGELKFAPEYDIANAEYKLLQIDPADEGSDDFAGGTFLVFNDKIVLHDVIYTKDTTEITEPLCVENIRNHKPNMVNVEGNGGWAQFGKNLRKQAAEISPNTPVKIYSSITNKNTRILAQAAFIKNRIYFRQDYKKFPMYAAFMRNFTGYLKEGTSHHDDAPDMCAGAAKFFRTYLEIFR